MIKGFEKLNIGKEEIEPGQCEISILIPRGYVKNSLANFGEELDDLNKLLGVFSEITTGKREE